MTSVQFEWGDTFGVRPNELLYLLIEGTKIEDSYLTFMRNCRLRGDNFKAFRVDLGGQNSKGDNFQLYHSDMHENCPLWHCPPRDFYEVMKKNSIFVPSIYIHEKLIRFYSKIVPSKVMMKNSIIVPSIYFHVKPRIFFLS